ncbi:MAG: antitoxin VapB family protein [Nanoarchaeota archaeon]
MATTIQISDQVKQRLERMKMFNRESYNEIIERMLEDEMELSAETKEDIKEARKSKGVPHEEVKKRFGL